MHVSIMGVSIKYIAMMHVLPMHVSMMGGTLSVSENDCYREKDSEFEIY